MKRYLYLLLFSSLILFVACDKNNDDINSKIFMQEDVNSEECYCVRSDEGDILSLRLCKMSNGFVQIDVEPLEGENNTEIYQAIIVSDKIEKIEEGLNIPTCPTKRRFIFDVTLGDLFNYTPKNMIHGDEIRNIPGPSVQLKCVCHAQSNGGKCIPVTVTIGNTTTYTCNSSIELPCKISNEQTCDIEYIFSKGNPESSSATKLIIDCDSLIYNGVLYY